MQKHCIIKLQNKEEIMIGGQYTQESLYKRIFELKKIVEDKANFEFLPMQKKMEKLLAVQDFQTYMELEKLIAPMRKEIADNYDELIKLREAYFKYYV